MLDFHYTHFKEASQVSKQKYTVITGASAGIGRATANAFAQRGCNLILVARRQEELEVLKQKLTTAFNIEVVVKACDLSIPTNVHNLYGDLRKFNIETWINNAGFGDYSTVASQNLAKIETMLRLNVEALTVLSSLYVGDYENTEGAQLINLSSRGGYMIVPNAVTYCATKFYVGG